MDILHHHRFFDQVGNIINGLSVYHLIPSQQVATGFRDYPAMS
jgi:hypothetical protein